MTNKSDGSTAANILRAAIGHMDQRAATYDKPEGERSMGATVDSFLAVTGVHMTEEQGWLFMALLKAVRSQQGAYRADSYEDGAAYFALAGEAAVRDRNGGWTPEAIKASALTAMPHAFGQQHTIEPASQIDDESPRMQAIGQNGNGGEHYTSSQTNWPDWSTHRVVRIESPLSGSQFAQECHGAYLSVKGKAFNMNRWRVVEQRQLAALSPTQAER